MAKRIVALYIMIIVCFMALLLKIVDINRQGYAQASENQSTKTLTVAKKRGNIYDRNLEPLVNADEFFVSAVTPVVAAAEELEGYLTKDEISDKIEKGYPFLCTVDRLISTDYIRTFRVVRRYSSEQTAVHLIGYLDSSGDNGVTGIEKAYNDFLNENSGSLKVSFEVDALGRVLAGMDKTITDDNYYSGAGVILTLDKEIQQIAEQALEKSDIESGAAVVMEAYSGKLLAVASVPEYDPENVAESLTAENSPLVNKAFQAYSVGSVFKPVIAAEAVEEGISTDYTYECSGQITVGDTVFSCYGEKAHGEINMTEALENSCNTYFINLIMKMDVSELLKLCSSIGFSESDFPADDIRTAAGILPQLSDLELKGNLANFAFGQGNLTATSLQLLSAYHVLSTGFSAEPSVIEGFIDQNGIISENAQAQRERLLSESTVKKMREMLQSVVENGNADKAKSASVSLAGKTGTAQSGVFENGNEILRTWFSGYFPADEPEYIIVILNERGVGGNADCAPVFKNICEEIALNFK